MQGSAGKPPVQGSAASASASASRSRRPGRNPATDGRETLGTPLGYAVEDVSAAPAGDGLVPSAGPDRPCTIPRVGSAGSASDLSPTTDAHEFERDQIRFLLKRDPDFCDFVFAHEIALESHFRLGSDDRLIVDKLAKSLVRTETLQASAARKRAQAAVAQMPYFTFDGKRLFKRLHSASDGALVERLVVPRGGAKALIFNGRRRTLTLRRRLLLEEHDSDAQGFHLSAKDTLATLSETAWWPGMELSLIHI